jgi:hypothetical protein
MRIPGPKTEGLTGKESMEPSPSNCNVMKSREVKLKVRVARIEENCLRNFSRKILSEDTTEESIREDVNIILKWIFTRMGCELVDWVQLAEDRVSGGTL